MDKVIKQLSIQSDLYIEFWDDEVFLKYKKVRSVLKHYLKIRYELFI